jgi:hypothetical protein
MDQIHNDSASCPEGTRKCGRSGDWHHQKCVSYDRKCVVNDIKFVSKSERNLHLKDKISNDTEDEWQFISFNDDIAIGLSSQ